MIQLPSLRRGLKGTVKRLLPPKLAASMRRYLRPSRLLRRDDYVIHMEMNCLPENDVWRIVEGRAASLLTALLATPPRPTSAVT